MAKLNIRIYGDEVLRKKCPPCEAPFSKLEAFVKNMFDTMYGAPGVGLAAPQVGRNLRLFVWDTGGGPKVAINPKLSGFSEETSVYDEGCLSFPELTFDVTRPERVTLRAYDLAGLPFTLDAEGLESRCIQHEFDHIDGVLFIDRVSEKIRKSLRIKLERIEAQAVTAVGQKKVTKSV